MRAAKFVVLFLIFIVSSLKPAKAQEVNYKSYTLFVYNFMKYIEWPEDGKEEFVVGVLGESPVYNELVALAKAKKVKGKTILLKKLSRPEEAAECHMVYIAPGKSSNIKLVNETIRSKPVLIVGEREGLASKGAALSFVTLEDDVLKFDINKNIIEQHALKIPSSLLALGILVK